MHAILCIYIIYTCIWCYVFVHTDLHSTLLFVFVWLHLIEGQFSVINLSQTVSLTHCAMISLPKHMLNIPISCMCCPPQAFILLQRGCFYFCRCFLWNPHGLLFTRKKQDALEAGLAPENADGSWGSILQITTLQVPLLNLPGGPCLCRSL